MKFNQELIEKLRNGEIAVKNDRDTETLKAVLIAAFKDGDGFNKIDSFLRESPKLNIFYAYPHWKEQWCRSDKSDGLPLHSVSDFILTDGCTCEKNSDTCPLHDMNMKPAEPRFEWGETVQAYNLSLIHI